MSSLSIAGLVKYTIKYTQVQLQSEVTSSLNPTRFPKRSMHVSWKRMGPRDSVWNHLCRKIMKIISQAKGIIRWSQIQFGSQVYSSCLKRWKFWLRKLQWTREWKKLDSQLQLGSCKKSKKARRMLFWKHKVTKGKSTLLQWWQSVISKMRG